MIGYALLIVVDELVGVHEEVSKELVHIFQLSGAILEGGIRSVLLMQSPAVLPPGLTVMHETKYEVPSQAVCNEICWLETTILRLALIMNKHTCHAWAGWAGLNICENACRRGP